LQKYIKSTSFYTGIIKKLFFFFRGNLRKISEITGLLRHFEDLLYPYLCVLSKNKEKKQKTRIGFVRLFMVFVYLCTQTTIILKPNHNDWLLECANQYSKYQKL